MVLPVLHRGLFRLSADRQVPDRLLVSRAHLPNSQSSRPRPRYPQGPPVLAPRLRGPVGSRAARSSGPVRPAPRLSRTRWSPGSRASERGARPRSDAADALPNHNGTQQSDAWHHGALRGKAIRPQGHLRTTQPLTEQSVASRTEGRTGTKMCPVPFLDRCRGRTR